MLIHGHQQRGQIIQEKRLGFVHLLHARTVVLTLVAMIMMRPCTVLSTSGMTGVPQLIVVLIQAGACWKLLGNFTRVYGGA